MARKIQFSHYNFQELLTVMEQDDWKHLTEPVARWKAKQAEAGLVNPPVLGPLVIFGEADGEPKDGREAVIQVILNRAVYRYGASIDIALLQPKQFTCLNFNDPSLWRVKSVTTERVREITLEFQAAVDLFEREGSLSPVGSATIYMTADCWRTIAVSWARGSDRWNIHKMIPHGQIGRHVFFSEV